MAKTGSERQREYSERKRKRIAEGDDLTSRVATSGDFARFMTNDDEAQLLRSFMAETLDSFGMSAPDLTIDEDPNWLPEWDGFSSQNGSLGRAERMASGLIDCGQQLAEIVNRFKLIAIDKELARLSANLTDPAARERAMGEAVRLIKIKELLSRKHRRDISAITVKGEF